MWTCRWCDFTKETDDDHKAVFHSCPGPPRRRRRITVGTPTKEEKVLALFAAFFDAVPEEDTLRKVEP